MRQTEFCKHYRAMSDHDTCEKGIAYDSFKGLPYEKRPCFERDGAAPCGCDLAEFPTAEERVERDRLMEIRFVNAGKARKAIVDHLGGPWKAGMDGDSGEIDCPVCGVGMALQFSRSGYNGHIHARCKTADCVCWME